jgi:hypothetical protein
MMSRAPIVAVLAASLFATATQSAAATRPRPDSIPVNQVYTEIAPNALSVFNDYATPSLVFSATRVVVHYVTDGPDAPPLNDDDADGVPDYVERVGDAADTAIAYYEQRGFAAIAGDTGGPDTRPDIYISRFAPGYFGVAFPAAAADGGAFVAIANNLDPSPARSLGSLYGTVAHELFHLVQFSSSREGSELPEWMLEGMAAAMESRVFPTLDDIVTSLQLRSWFAAPQRGVTHQTYGSQLLWRFLDAGEPQLLPLFLGDPARTLAASYERLTGRRFRDVFHRFALWVADDYTRRLTPRRTVRPRTRTGGVVAPLAVDYLRLAHDVRSTGIRFSGAPGNVTLVYERVRQPGAPALVGRIRPRSCGGMHCLTWAIPRALRANDVRATLVVSNGSSARTVTYRLEGG